MKDAEDALKDGDLPGALDKQAEAMDKMREGLRDFGAAMADQERQQGASPDGTQKTEDPQSGGPRDPLGRENGLHIGSDGNLAENKDIYKRAQELLDQIRKRSADQSRTEQERSYLNRLLDLF